MYENSSDDCITINNKYIIPQKSRFINDDINICKQLIYSRLQYNKKYLVF